MKKRKKTVTRKKKSKSSRRAPALIVLLLPMLGFLTAAGVFFYADKLVQRTLNRPAKQSSAIVLSRSEVLDKHILQDPKALKLMLNNRNFSETQGKPVTAGEYRINNQTAQIYSHEFELPDGSDVPAKIREVEFKNPEASEILLESKVLTNLGSGDQRATLYKSLNNIPKNLQHAVLAIEDERFFKHFGIDLIGISRAMFTNLVHLSFVQGGSTITQQLAKNILFTPKKTLTRKIMEAFAALSLEMRLSKNKILEMYLNEVYLGQQGPMAVHGMAAAARAYFNKDIADLNLSESATLAGLIKAPSYYSPTKHADRAKDRRDIVLDKMFDLEFISKSEYKAAKNSALHINKTEIRPRANFFAEALKRNLKKSMELTAIDRPGVKIHTALSVELQACAERSLKDGLARIEKDHPVFTRRKDKLEAALLAIEAETGMVRAWVGGRDYRSSQFDHIDQAKRQIGSTIKPFVYLTALNPLLNNYKPANPATILPDREIQIKIPYQDDYWIPQNYDKKFRGEVTLRYALEHSLNVPAAYLGQKVNPEKIANTLKLFGLAENALPVPSIALGALEASLLNLTAAYAALANGGTYIEPRLWTTITDYDGSILARSAQKEIIASEEAPVYVLTNILQGVIQRGTGSSIRANGYVYPAAGKTGTTDDARDAWFVGYTPALAAGVWIGFDDNSKVGLSGGQVAAPIWADFMKCASIFDEPETFVPPNDITYAEIDSATGLLYHDGCNGEAIREVFVRGTEPRRYCDETSDRPQETRPFEEPRPKNFWDNLFG